MAMLFLFLAQPVPLRPEAATTVEPAARRRFGVAVALLAAAGGWAARAATPAFTDVTAAAGLVVQHGYLDGVLESMPRMISGGVAAGDYDRDGWVDLFAIQGEMGPAVLYRNRGDGTFEEVAAAAGVALPAGFASGPAFGDYDGDGWLDLIVGGIEGLSPVRLFRNRGDGTFEETTAASGLAVSRRQTFSAAFGDYDRDGDLDLFLAHWTQSEDCAAGACGQHLWRNRGDGTFSDADAEAGLAAAYTEKDSSFTPNFTDYDGDGWPDLLVASDFATTKVFHNRGDGTFENVTDPAAITDDNGMGAAIADFDRDGDLDWFVTSIYDPHFGKSGNRLYLNQGDGRFADPGEASGIRHGSWGWAACAGDFDRDGDDDIFHVNGFQDEGFETDPSRLFLANGDGTFTERAAEAGLGSDTAQGRGLVCFDYDRDGDLDLYVANNSGPSTLWRNEGPGGHWLAVVLSDSPPNPAAVGAQIYLTAGGATQLEELRMGSHFASQDPTEAHFGLGAAEVADELAIRWPDGSLSTHGALPADRHWEVRHHYGNPKTTTYTEPATFPFGGCSRCQLEATLSVAPGGRRAGAEGRLIGWIRGPGDKVAVSLVPAAGQVVFRQWDDHRLVRRAARTLPIEPGRAYDVKVDYDGERFRVLLDGVPILAPANAASRQPFGEVAVAMRNATLTVHNLAVTAERSR